MEKYRIIQKNGQPAIICFECWNISFNPNDIEQRYCGHCKVFHPEYTAEHKAHVVEIRFGGDQEKLIDHVIEEMKKDTDEIISVEKTQADEYIRYIFLFKTGYGPYYFGHYSGTIIQRLGVSGVIRIITGDRT